MSHARCKPELDRLDTEICGAASKLLHLGEMQVNEVIPDFLAMTVTHCLGSLTQTITQSNEDVRRRGGDMTEEEKDMLIIPMMTTPLEEMKNRYFPLVTVGKAFRGKRHFDKLDLIPTVLASGDTNVDDGKSADFDFCGLKVKLKFGSYTVLSYVGTCVDHFQWENDDGTSSFVNVGGYCSVRVSHAALKSEKRVANLI